MRPSALFPPWTEAWNGDATTAGFAAAAGRVEVGTAASFAAADDGEGG